MTSLAAAAIVLLGQAGGVNDTRLVTLPNGAKVYTERMTSLMGCSVQLWASSAGCEDTVSTQGLRHLLEHCAAHGRKGDIDKRLEAKGVVLTASTERDAMIFRIDCPPSQLEPAIAALTEIVQNRSFTKEQISKEAAIIESEMAVRSNGACAAASIWNKAFGSTRLDAMGDPIIQRRAAPEDLSAAADVQFRAGNLVMVIVGNIDPESAKQKASDAVRPIKSAPEPASGGVAASGRVAVPSFIGSAAGIRSESFSSKASLVNLGVGMALAQHLGDPSFVYTASTRPGMMSLVSTTSGLASRIRGTDVGYLVSAPYHAAYWVKSFRRSPGALASIRAACLIRDDLPGSLEEAERVVTTINDDDIRAAFDRWKQCLEVGE